MTELPLSMMARIPWLLLRLLFSALKFKRRALKSARMVRKGMVKAGMDRELARRLTLEYEEAFSIRRLMGRATGGSSGLSSLFPFGR